MNSSRMSPRRIGEFLLLMLITIQISAAQEIVNSVFTPFLSEPTYSNPANWTPPEVPNNSPAKSYNITIRKRVELDIDATVSNLLIESEPAELIQQDHSLTVIGTTTINRSSKPFTLEDIAIHSFNASGASFVTDTLSTFSEGTLGGRFNLWTPNLISGSATLQFHGADVRTLTGELLLRGPLTRIIDEFGNDGLRSLTHIEAEAILVLAGHQTSVAGPFTNDGRLFVSSALNQPGLFTIMGELTNFDPANHTLTNGSYTLGGGNESGTNQPTILQFPGADIVNNGGSIALGDPLAKIVDENGSDALRNFSHNTATGTFGVLNFSLSKAGNFTNDGTLFVDTGTLIIQGELTNFDPVTHTLTGGAYVLFQNNQSASSARLVFTGADIANNDALIGLYGSVRILDQDGNDALRNLAHNLPGGTLNLVEYFDFISPADFTNSGQVIIQSFSKLQSHFVLPKDHRYVQTEGGTHLFGGAFIGDMDINGGAFDTYSAGENRAVLNGNLAVGDALFVPRSFVVHGAVQLSAGSTFSTSGDSDNAFTVTDNINVAGTLQIAAPQTPPPSTAVFYVMQGGAGGVTGEFSNAPDGARIPTMDGLGSFIVSYGSQSIFIFGYQGLTPTPHLLNLSTRGPVGTGENVLVGGLIVTGTQPKRVILRALGPSLSSLLPGALPNPVLEVHDSSGGLIASNDNWRTDQEAEIIATGIPPGNDLESALVMTLPANHSAYTAAVRGADSGTGIGVVEVYDLDRGTDSRIANISTRGVVQTGDNTLIAGLIVLNQNPTRVLVRALGPSLLISERLPDPTLSLYDSNGVLIAFNDNWRSDQQDEIVATGLLPGNELDAAIVTTFPSLQGSYTAVVRGKDGSTGVALVEVYDLSQ